MLLSFFLLLLHLFSLLLLIVSEGSGGPLLAINEQPPPSPALKFTGKSPSAKRIEGEEDLKLAKNAQELLRVNPLLATLAMFRDSNNNNIGESLMFIAPLEMVNTSDERSSTFSGSTHPNRTITTEKEEEKKSLSLATKSVGTTNRRTRIGRQRNKIAGMVGAQKTRWNEKTSPLFGQQIEGDNFHPLQQFFNATLFELAIPMEKEKGLAKRKGIEDEVAEGGGRRYFDASWREIRRPLTVDESNEEEKQQQQLPPFEVTDSLRLALSSTEQIPTSPSGNRDHHQRLPSNKESTPAKLAEQEHFSLNGSSSGRTWLYPWERQRGDFEVEQAIQKNSNASTSLLFQPTSTTSSNYYLESATTTISPPSFYSSTGATPPLPSFSSIPAPMHGAHFYADQHVSRGMFGRAPSSSEPTLVYDPNVLQNRYGYSGLLPQLLPDGRYTRLDTTNGYRQNGVVAVQRSFPGPTEILPPPSILFFIPATSPPRPLNLARALMPIRASAFRDGGGGNKNYTTFKENKFIGRSIGKLQKSTSLNGISEEMSPLGGNPMRWMPLTSAITTTRIKPPKTTTATTTTISTSIEAKTTAKAATTIASTVEYLMCAPGRDIIVLASRGFRLADSNSYLRGHLRRRKQRSVVVGESPSPPPPSSSAPNRIVKILGQSGSETECIFSCMVNVARDRSPFECLAATYDRIESRCLLYGPGSAADGSVSLVPNPSSVHFEKGCLLEQLVAHCRGLPIHRHPQKTLLGFALSSRHADSLTVCLEHCWLLNVAGSGEDEGADAQRCRSVMFFYDIKNGENNLHGNCVLNSESRESAPSAFFVDENEAIVDYASFEGCNDESSLESGEVIGGQSRHQPKEQEQQLVRFEEKEDEEEEEIGNNAKRGDEQNEESRNSDAATVLFGHERIKSVSATLMPLPASPRALPPTMSARTRPRPTLRIALNSPPPHHHHHRIIYSTKSGASVEQNSAKILETLDKQQRRNSSKAFPKVTAQTWRNKNNNHHVLVGATARRHSGETRTRTDSRRRQGQKQKSQQREQEKFNFLLLSNEEGGKEDDNSEILLQQQRRRRKRGRVALR